MRPRRYSAAQRRFRDATLMATNTYDNALATPSAVLAQANRIREALRRRVFVAAAANVNYDKPQFISLFRSLTFERSVAT
jgi:hypothetical protein